MSDYIKREDAVIEIERFGGYLDDDMLYRIKLALNRLPSADVVEVRHGRWIKSKAGGVLCSECYSYAPNVEKGSFTTRRIEQEKSAYCPNCGAKMDGKEQEHE